MNHTPGPEPKQGMSGCAKVAIGCGILTVIAVIVGGIGVWWVASNVRQFGADAASSAMKEGLRELELPEDQQERIFGRIDEVAQRFKDKQITLEEVGQIFERIGQGPLMSAGLALVAERAYLEQSGFDEEEKAAARTAIQRFSHGVINEMIAEAEVNAVLDEISTQNAGGGREFQHPVTDEQLRSFVAAAKQAADDANVPEEVDEVNFADEFDKAVDEALGDSPPGS